jgi:hypothetical protein
MLSSNVRLGIQRYFRFFTKHYIRISATSHLPIRFNYGLDCQGKKYISRIQIHRTLVIESFARDRGRTSVRAENGYPKGSAATVLNTVLASVHTQTTYE